jgi:hypothetical protein
MTKLIVAFRSFAKEPKNKMYNHQNHFRRFSYKKCACGTRTVFCETPGFCGTHFENH